MLHYRTSTEPVTVYGEEGQMRFRGSFFLSENNTVEFFTEQEQAALVGVGVFNPSTGYCVYRTGDES